MTDMLLMALQSINPSQKWRSFQKCNKEMAINHGVKTYDTTQYQVVSLYYVENEYCSNHRQVQVNQPECVPSNNLFPTAMASGFGQSSFDLCDLCSDVEQYLTPNNVAEMRPE
jgi:hypothetical protein